MLFSGAQSYSTDQMYLVLVKLNIQLPTLSLTLVTRSSLIVVGAFRHLHCKKGNVSV